MHGYQRTKSLPPRVLACLWPNCLFNYGDQRI